MNIGIVCWWYNRGQANVGRYIRSIFDEFGHQTFVLARPTREGFDLSAFIDSTDVWQQPRVTHASHTIIPQQEYIDWIENNALDVVFFDQNYQFREITYLRKKVRTIGRFVWEFFDKTHAAFAALAFDTIYCFTHSEQLRYRSFGLDCPRITWGCHPELLPFSKTEKKKEVTFFYQGGFLDYRKPVAEVVKAFSLSSSNTKLIIKAQTEKVSRYQKHIEPLEPLDPRIKIICKDLCFAEYYQLFSSCHVCIAPSRWEGLGLPLYEAIAFGMPIITNDNPPMNEVVQHHDNGILVNAHQQGSAPSGIPAYVPDVESLTAAINELSCREKIALITQNALQKRHNWEQTKQGFAQLLAKELR